MPHSLSCVKHGLDVSFVRNRIPVSVALSRHLKAALYHFSHNTLAIKYALRRQMMAKQCVLHMWIFYVLRNDVCLPMNSQESLSSHQKVSNRNSLQNKVNSQSVSLFDYIYVYATVLEEVVPVLARDDVVLFSPLEQCH